MTQLHHVIPRAAIKRARSRATIKAKRFEQLTEAEQRLLDTPITRIFADTRNLVKMTKREHERHHSGTLRLDPSRLPLEIHDFADDYALERDLERELELLTPRPPKNLTPRLITDHAEESPTRAETEAA